MLMLVLLLLLVLILTPTFASYLAILLELVLLGCIRWRCFRIVNNQVVTTYSPEAAYMVC